MSSERAGTPTHDRLDHQAAREALRAGYWIPDGDVPIDTVLDALEACVVPDPRITRIEALCDEADRDRPNALAAHVVFTSDLRAALRTNNG